MFSELFFVADAGSMQISKPARTRSGLIALRPMSLNTVSFDTHALSVGGFVSWRDVGGTFGGSKCAGIFALEPVTTIAGAPALLEVTWT